MMVSFKFIFKSVNLYLLSIMCITYTIALTSDTVPTNYDFDALGSPLNTNPSEKFEEEYNVFLEELENGTAKRNGKSRQKRYVYLNTETNLDVGYLIVIPITVVVPSMSNLFNVWRRKRSLDNFSLNISSEEATPFLQSQMERISSYFDLVNVPEKACQLRATCELSAEPSTYFPLSDIVLSKIRHPVVISKLQSESNTSEQPSLLKLFNQAADEGISLGKQHCESKYAKSCKYSIDRLLNMPVMKFWKKLQSTLRLKFDDDSIESV